MLYPKNQDSRLSDELFRHPTSEYRAAPFWAWNCKLEKDELLQQLDVLRQMAWVAPTCMSVQAWVPLI